MSRVEVEVDLTEEEFREAWDLTAGRRLRKVRVSYSFRTARGEVLAVSVDSFRDRLSGLVLAEIEFDDPQASARFELPAFLGIEVTDDPRYRNAALAHATAPPLLDEKAS